MPLFVRTVIESIAPPVVRTMKHKTDISRLTECLHDRLQKERVLITPKVLADSSFFGCKSILMMTVTTVPEKMAFDLERCQPSNSPYWLNNLDL